MITIPVPADSQRSVHATLNEFSCIKRTLRLLTNAINLYAFSLTFCYASATLVALSRTVQSARPFCDTVGIPLFSPTGLLSFPIIIDRLPRSTNCVRCEGLYSPGRHFVA